MATIDLGKIKQVFRGTYNNATAYAVDDLVVFTDGSVTSTYICTTASTGNNPSSGGTAHANWAFVAKGQATSPTTTQGDVIVRGASADQRLAIGAAGKVLKVNSGGNGLEYGTGGGILQVITTKKTDIFSTTSTSNVDVTGFSATITPSSSSHKVLVLVHIGHFTGDDTMSIHLTLGDNTSILAGDAVSGKQPVSTGDYSGGNSTGNGWYGAKGSPLMVLHSPNTTSATTYKIRCRVNTGTGYINRNMSDGSQYNFRTASTITLMEVAV